MRTLEILVAEDDPTQREVLADLLRDAGFRVATAADGESARSLLRARPPDVLILDVMMPGVDGPTLLREVREDPRCADVRVILTTGVHTPHVTRLLRPDAALFKPFGMAELLAAIRAVSPAP